MSLSSSQQKRCLEVMDKLCSRRISHMFAQPVDPERDNCPNYFDIVKTPMDLGTVRKKLTAGQYKTVADWKADVNLIWSNSNAYNAKTSLLRCITKDLSDYYHKLTVYLTDSPQNDWAEELNYYTSEFNQIMKDMSDPSHDAIPIPIPNPLPPVGSDRTPSQEKKNKSNPKQRSSSHSSTQKPSVPQLQTAAAGQTTPTNQPIQTRQKSKKNSTDETERNERVIFKEEKKHARPFSKDQLLALSHDINTLEDINQQNILVELIKANEADVKDNGGEVEVDLNTLRSSTLRLLREQVDTFMEENYF
ncbi:Bromodomain containing protein [Tritrichomonas foetus]|uniref:Bromodomain containing protein n=1 Tax=Tritrichomonas foetus TaxID=1144522 RepID=A0A1J4K4Q4_9EUKA|nr:Bromodomain containing protein [Tritrichomonas foetus]|eukprot:OHT05954.1 Bromodomain containing protein [Tritrichomonas foetus]